ncbi:uncharacterized protein B0I36DRAFT_345764 [Microdochium trichocladiopsis]|uniref:Uncharacterized protein n=1 Tax=Microdochium trichocladiopsis TaxID=1682393 RepID=A0A9P8YGT9_9PEZI|nr:uncharacterized protein B0I36DRAFT_345764 [Microdochium trichocladiopsis]KAH7037688.1 hypothetical protein B0I36DRAFT_345764 [Microdochium trichocladiopsis]
MIAWSSAYVYLSLREGSAQNDRQQMATTSERECSFGLRVTTPSRLHWRCEEQNILPLGWPRATVAGHSHYSEGPSIILRSSRTAKASSLRPPPFIFHGYTHATKALVEALRQGEGVKGHNVRWLEELDDLHLAGRLNGWFEPLRPQYPGFNAWLPFLDNNRLIVRAINDQLQVHD